MAPVAPVATGATGPAGPITAGSALLAPVLNNVVPPAPAGYVLIGTVDMNGNNNGNGIGGGGSGNRRYAVYLKQ